MHIGTHAMPTRWELDQLEHRGEQSTLNPPEGDKRHHSVPRHTGLGGFKRAADVAYEAAAEMAALKQRRGPASKAAKQSPVRGRHSAESASPPAKGTPIASAVNLDGQLVEPKRKRPLEALPMMAQEKDESADPDPDEQEPAQAASRVAAKKRRSRPKKGEAGEWGELKPRHLKGKRRESMEARQVANAQAAADRRASQLAVRRGEAEGSEGMGGAGSADAAFRSPLSRQLPPKMRPKLRRWCVYQLHTSAVDHGWFARNEFTEVLQAAGLGHMTRLTRAEWSYLKLLLGTARRFSAAFIAGERKKLCGERPCGSNSSRVLHSLSGGHQQMLPFWLNTSGCVEHQRMLPLCLSTS